MASPNRSTWAGFKSYQHRPAPRFDEAQAKNVWLSVGNTAANIATRKVRNQFSTNTQRLKELVETDRDTRGDIA